MLIHNSDIVLLSGWILSFISIIHNRALNGRINRIHEQALRIVYRDKTSSFTELLQNNNAVTVHQRNLQLLATEFYKVKMDVSPQLVKERFSLIKYTIWDPFKNLNLWNVKTVHYGTKSLSFLGPKIWELLPLEIKSFQTLPELKKKLNHGSQKIILTGSVKLTFIT